MRRRAIPAIALLGLIAGAATAQQGAPHPGTPVGVADVPAGEGRLRVRVEHPERAEAAAGLPVVLYALPLDGEPGLRGATTDERGEAVFEQIASDPDTPYLAGVRYAGVPFGARVRFAAGQTEQALVLRISDPSPDAAAVSVGEARLELETACSGIQVLETWELRNAGDTVVFVPEEARAAAEPVFETEVPEAAVGLAAGPTAVGLEIDGRRARFWGPLHPGSHRLDLGYGLPADAAGRTLRRGFPSGAGRLVVEAGPGGPRVEPSGVVAEPVEPGASFDLALARVEPASEPAGLKLHGAKIWLELDDAALRADERYEVETLERSAGPLCLSLPEGARDLRFSSASLALGLSRDPSGALVVRGPFPPERWILSLRYLLPSRPSGLSLARRFPLEVPLLSIYVADTGIRAESGRLHRRRPVLSEERSYIHFEAFGIAADEELVLGLRPVPVAARAPGAAVAGFMALSALAVLLFLAAPLRRGPGPEADAAAPEASLESESLDAALGDLEHDFETGKLAPEDYESFGRELRRRAEELRRQASPPPEAPSPAEHCDECGAAFAPTARFCSQCGARRREPKASAVQ